VTSGCLRRSILDMIALRLVSPGFAGSVILEYDIAKGEAVLRKLDYAKNHEILMAVVTHLAVGKWPSRQPKGIANDLSIDPEAIRSVLKTFKGLFRESKGRSRDHGEPLYSLHLRFARVGGAESEEERPPLDTQDLFSLLKFVSEKSTQQSQQASALRIAALTSLISLIVAAASLFVAFHKG
jgi:hypothetical protein